MSIGKRLRASAGLGLALAALAGGAAVAQGAMKNITYVQPNPSAINSFPVYVAIGEGYFKDEGLYVRTETVDGSAPVLQALAAGQAQIGRPGPAPVLNARARGVDVVFLYNSLPKSSFGITVKRDDPYKSVSRPQGQDDRHRHPRRRRGRLRPRHPQRRRHAGGQGLHLHPGRRRRPRHRGLPARRHPGLCRGDPDAAILNARGVPVRDITPDKFQSYFGNGYAALRELHREEPGRDRGVRTRPGAGVASSPSTRRTARRC